MTKIDKIRLADIDMFQSGLRMYKDIIDHDITQYSKQVQKSTLQQFGAYSRLEIDSFLNILARGGKRIRGALTMLGYEMSGGTDREMITQAARAIEMLHAYILIIDDFQDRSILRRGGPTAQVMLADYHREKHLAGNSEHFGASIGLNAALSGNHAAQMILTNLAVDNQLKINALSIINRTMLVTAHGQTGDIMNEVVAQVSQKAVQKVSEWKTAHYTILNPLHVGMVLAGADCHDTDAITPYAMQTGLAFQITDDILGIFGSEFESGKSPTDDIREGKRTLISVFALEHATNSNKNFLIQMLGNEHITQAEFLRCKDIIQQTGALTYAKTQANNHIDQALHALNKESTRWSSDGVQFLRGLALYLRDRES